MATGFDLVPCFPSTRRAKHSEHAGRIPHISERLRLLQQVHNQPSAVWDKSPTGGNDQRPPAGQLTALILHNDSPHFPRTAAVRAAARPGRHPTFNVTSERWKRVRGGGGSTFKLSAGSPPKECLTFAAALLPVQIHGWWRRRRAPNDARLLLLEAVGVCSSSCLLFGCSSTASPLLLVER